MTARRLFLLFLPLAGMLAFSLFANRIRLDQVMASEGLFEMQ